MNVRLERLQPFLVDHPKPLLLINNDEPKAFEIDALGKLRGDAREKAKRQIVRLGAAYFDESLEVEDFSELDDDSDFAVLFEESRLSVR